jgi:hypothetical protein
MIDFLKLFVHILETQARLEAEISVLRHQLNVLRRQAPLLDPKGIKHRSGRKLPVGRQRGLAVID